MKTFLALLAETFRQWSAHRVPRMGAALSFYTIFSLAPLVIFILWLVSLVVERNTARAEIVEQFREFVGPQAAETVETILTRTAAASTGLWEAMVGFVVLLVGASGVFGELQDSLNQIWDVSSKRHPLFVIIKERALALAMLFLMGFLMLVSFLFSAIGAAAGDFLHGRFPRLDGPWEWVNSLVSLLLVAMLFAVIFRMVPDALIAWNDVWMGALMAAVLFVLGKHVLGTYFGRSAIASSYGAAGSLIILLVWVFYSAQIMLFGAEFTRVYAIRHGSHRRDASEVK
jgi:membrane protein